MVKLYNASYLQHRISKSWALNDIMNRKNQYMYKGNSYNALEKIDFEELSFQNGKLSGTSKSFSQGKLSFQLFMNLVSEEVLNNNNKKEIFTSSEPKEISYFQEGNLVKTIHFIPACANCRPAFETYEFEFENGVNITLKALDQKIAEGNSYLKAANYEMAISTLEEARKNKFPAAITQNMLLDKAIANVKNQQATFLRKEEEKRVAEERKKLVEEEKRRKSEMGSDKYICKKLSEYTWVAKWNATNNNTYMNFTFEKDGYGSIICWDDMSDGACLSAHGCSISNGKIETIFVKNTCGQNGSKLNLSYNSNNNTISFIQSGKLFIFQPNYKIRPTGW
jgi:hypothetical protein